MPAAAVCAIILAKQLPVLFFCYVYLGWRAKENKRQCVTYFVFHPLAVTVAAAVYLLN
jgi:hypothetical protein